jgi:hypothetical protein
MWMVPLPEMVPLTWIEHVTSPLPRECSTTELQGQGGDDGLQKIAAIHFSANGS